MRIEQLRYVEAVARLGSFRRAAEELHLSQPALSEAIANLERELGIVVLDRGRSGTRVSAPGRELLPHVLNVLDAVDALHRAADEQHASRSMVRIGTVNAATVSLLTPVVQAFREAHPGTQVEVVGAQASQIHHAMREGSMHLGLLTALDGDQQPAEFEATELLRGRIVACVRTDSPLAELPVVSPAELAASPLVVMRSGYLMHRFLHRFLGDRAPSFSYSTDGAEMGKLMVAQGLGATVLPDFSVADDPLEQRGIITHRPLTGDQPDVLLVLQRRRRGMTTMPARALHRLFIEHAARYGPPLAA